MKAIQVTGNFTTLVDDQDYEFLSQYRWCFTKTPRSHTVYARRFISKGVYALMHRDILGVGKGEYVDHIDGNGLNNQRSNLRLCNQSANGGNSQKHRISSSRYKGVSYNARRKKWYAYICPNRTYVHLGVFMEEREAALAYNRAAVEYFGEFARLNEV